MISGPAATRRPTTAYFSPDYVTARERFRRAADEAGARRKALALAATGPGGVPLTIDLAWLAYRLSHATRIMAIDVHTGLGP